MCNTHTYIFLPCAASATLISYRSLSKRGALSLMSRMVISIPRFVSMDESGFVALNFSYRLKEIIQSLSHDKEENAMCGLRNCDFKI